MEESENDAVFEKLDPNPTLFLNETLNAVDDLLDNAFRFFHLEASKCVEIEDNTDRSHHLSEGTTYLRSMIVSQLDMRLDMWKEYCLRHCFKVPKGFCLPKEESVASEAVLCDSDLDTQLESLRAKLTKIGKESIDLSCELEALERQCASKDCCSMLINEALQLNEKSSLYDMFNEMMRTASELRTKMEKLRDRGVEDVEHNSAKRIRRSNIDLSMLEPGKGLSQAKLDDLQELLGDLKSITQHKYPGKLMLKNAFC